MLRIEPKAERYFLEAQLRANPQSYGAPAAGLSDPVLVLGDLLRTPDAFSGNRFEPPTRRIPGLSAGHRDVGKGELSHWGRVLGRPWEYGAEPALTGLLCWEELLALCKREPGLVQSGQESTHTHSHGEPGPDPHSQGN